MSHVPLGSTTVSLALQGGASLGAYTWGVLDAILADGRLHIEGVTGASAGAINAAAVASGLAAAGPDGARDALRAFWEGLAARATRRHAGDLLATILRYLPTLRSREAFYALTTRLAADGPLDPDTMEPVRGAIGLLNLALLGHDRAPKVFVNTTDVETGQPVVFTGREIDVDVLCASCAVPMVFAPVEVRGRWYWDGGLTGNPAIYPVIYGCETSDVVLVETRTGPKPVPATPADVISRTMELASGAGLVRELRSIAFLSRLVREHPRPGIREIRVHRIPGHPGLADVKGARAFRADLRYFHELFALGRDAGSQWLAAAVPALAPAA